MLAALTGMGLSAAAGLNAYIPFLVVALIARYSDIITLPENYAWIESGWSIAVASVLLIAEVVLDKIPAVDTLNDTVQTLVRPTVGGLIFAATAAAQDFEESSSWIQENQWFSIVLGVVMAGLVHSGKTAVRPAINAGSLGTATPVVSAVEDTASVGLSLTAIFFPLLVIFLLAWLFGVLAWLFVLVHRWRERRRARAESGA